MWDILEKLATITGILTAIPVFLSWQILLGYRKRQREILESIKANPGDRPMALAISIARDRTPIDISNQVRDYLASIQENMDVESLALPMLTIDKTPELVEALRKSRAKMIEKGVKQIHLFYMGPVVGALLVGDVFSNSAVQIYHHNQQTGGYEKWGPLTHSIL